MSGRYFNNSRLDILPMTYGDLFLVVFGERQVRLFLLLSNCCFGFQRCHRSGRRCGSNGLGGGRVFVGKVKVVIDSSKLNPQQVGGEFAPRIVVFVLGRAGSGRLFGHERLLVHEESARVRTGRV